MIKRISFLIFAIMFLFFVSVDFVSAKDNSAAIESKQPVKDTLSVIDSYQAEYFEIVKRNNVLLNFENNAKLKKDRKELKKLSAKVEKQITNKKYLNEYKKIKKQIGKCEGITTPEINECAENDYSAVNSLLNKVYIKAKSKMSSEDFKNLKLSQNKWQKEVEDYKKVYDSMEFGTIGTSAYYDYEINMREFRALLLMLFLK